MCRKSPVNLNIVIAVAVLNNKTLPVNLINVVKSKSKHIQILHIYNCHRSNLPHIMFSHSTHSSHRAYETNLVLHISFMYPICTVCT